MTAIVCILFLWHIICSSGDKLSIGRDCNAELEDAEEWPANGIEQQKQYLKNLWSELSKPKWKITSGSLNELYKEDDMDNVYTAFMKKWKKERDDKGGKNDYLARFNPAEAWAINEYAANGVFCKIFRNQWRQSCQGIPEIYSKLVYKATHKPDKEHRTPALDFPYYSGYSNVEAPPLTVIEDKVNFGVGRLYGPWSASTALGTAEKFAGDGTPSFILKIQFPKNEDIDVWDFGFLNAEPLSPHERAEEERIFWNVPTKYVSYYRVNGKTLGAYESMIPWLRVITKKYKDDPCNPKHGEDPKLGFKLRCLVDTEDINKVEKEQDKLKYRKWCKDVEDGIEAIMEDVKKDEIKKAKIRVYIFKALYYHGCPDITGYEINKELTDYVKLKNKGQDEDKAKMDSRPMVDYYNYYGGFYDNALLFLAMFIGFTVICICWMMISALIGFVLGLFISKVKVDEKEDLDESETVDV